jgi:hypothetical protein
VPPKLFSLDEANALLPRLEPLMHRLREMRQELRRHQQAVAEFQARASRNGGGSAGGQFAHAKAETERLAAQIHEGVRQIESWGCVVKDLDLGLVDFLWRRGREEVFLCWRLGERDIRFWHGLHEGFAGRKPIAEDRPD